jgi:hypothetical protein
MRPRILFLDHTGSLGGGVVAVCSRLGVAGRVHFLGFRRGRASARRRFSVDSMIAGIEREITAALANHISR